MVQQFEYGNTGQKDVYLDEDNRRRLNIMKLASAQLAISLVKEGKKAKAQEVLRAFEHKVNASNLPWGMTSNRGNQHNAISAEFLRAAYLCNDAVLVKKIIDPLKADLQQQLHYYRMQGDQERNNDQLAQQAYQFIQGQAADLSERQKVFANDILSSYQLLYQVDQWASGIGISGL
jgi:hypothetical protein